MSGLTDDTLGLQNASYHGGPFSPYATSIQCSLPGSNRPTGLLSPARSDHREDLPRRSVDMPIPTTLADEAERERRLLKRAELREKVWSGTAPESCLKDDSLLIPRRFWSSTKAEAILTTQRVKWDELREKSQSSSSSAESHGEFSGLKRLSDWEESSPKKQKTSSADHPSNSAKDFASAILTTTFLDGNEEEQDHSPGPAQPANWHQTVGEIKRGLRSKTKSSTRSQKKKSASPIYRPLSLISDDGSTTDRKSTGDREPVFMPDDESEPQWVEFITECEEKRQALHRRRKAWEKEVDDEEWYVLGQDDHEALAKWNEAVASHTHEENLAMVQKWNPIRDAPHEKPGNTATAQMYEATVELDPRHIKEHEGISNPDVVMQDVEQPPKRTSKPKRIKSSKTIPSSRITRSKASQTTDYLKLDRSGKLAEAWN